MREFSLAGPRTAGSLVFLLWPPPTYSRMLRHTDKCAMNPRLILSPALPDQYFAAQETKSSLTLASCRFVPFHAPAATPRGRLNSQMSPDRNWISMYGGPMMQVYRGLLLRKPIQKPQPAKLPNPQVRRFDATCRMRPATLKSGNQGGCCFQEGQQERATSATEVPFPCMLVRLSCNEVAAWCYKC